jgi:hypothetical protein
MRLKVDPGTSATTHHVSASDVPEAEPFGGSWRPNRKIPAEKPPDMEQNAACRRGYITEINAFYRATKQPN